MIKHLLASTLLFVLVACTTQSFAQTAPAAAQQDKNVYVYVEEMPQYAGGYNALMQFLTDSISKAEAKAKGKVILSFVVDSDGTVNDVAVLKSVGEKVDKACINAVKATTGNWTPGRQNGEAVAVRFTLPIKFRR